MKRARFAQLSAVALALVLVLSAGVYGITRGLLADNPPPSWGRLEIINLVLNHIRADPCNHPDASTVKATRTTRTGAADILAKRWDPNEWSGSPDGGSPDNTPLWLVEVQGEIPVIGGTRGVKECEEPPSGVKSLVFYIVTVDGKVSTGFGKRAP